MRQEEGLRGGGKRRCRTSEYRGKTCVKKIRDIFETKVHDDIPSIKYVDRKKTKRETGLVNIVIANLKINSESEGNKLLTSVAFLVAEMLGVQTRQKSEKSRKRPYWKRRIESNVKTWRKRLKKLEEVRQRNHVLC